MADTKQKREPGATVDWVYSVLAVLVRLLPRFVTLWFVRHVVSPRQAAYVVRHFSKRRLVAIVCALPPDYAATVAGYLGSGEIAVIAQNVPVPVLVEVSKALAAKGEYATMARFGMSMSLTNVKTLVVLQDDPRAMAQTARYYDSPTLAKIADGFSGAYASRMAVELEKLGLEQVEVGLGQCMRVDHLAELLMELSSSQAARFLSGVSGERLREVLVRMTEPHASEIRDALASGESGG